MGGSLTGLTHIRVLVKSVLSAVTIAVTATAVSNQSLLAGLFLN